MFDATVLQGKRILITGGGTGLGKEMAVGFAAHGAHVYICGRRREMLDQATREIRERSGGRADALIANVRDPDSIEAMMAAIWAGGPLTGLVNNAAANFLAPTEPATPSVSMAAIIWRRRARSPVWRSCRRRIGSARGNPFKPQW